MELKSYVYDDAAIHDGRWFNFIDNSKIKLRSLTSKESERSKRELDIRYGVSRRNNLNQDQLLDYTRDHLVESIIIDWSGFVMGGQEFPYSKENAALLLKEYPFITSKISEILLDETAFLADYKGATLKN